MTDSRARVLIVDDHPDAAESLAIVLEAEGFHVQTALDGRTACELAESWRPQALLVDLDLPVVGGLEIARRLRSAPAGGDLLLLAITGYGRESDREASRAAGFDAHLTKPVEPSIVLDWLASLAPCGAERPRGTAAP